MPTMPGSTVQCMNPQCPARGLWLRAELVGTDSCPTCGETLRHVLPPLMPRHQLRPRPQAPRPSFRPR